VVEECAPSVLPDAAWADYQGHGNPDTLAVRHTQWFRATFMPSLALGLGTDRDAEARMAFADALEGGMTRRLASRAEPIHSLVQTFVLAKAG